MKPKSKERFDKPAPQTDFSFDFLEGLTEGAVNIDKDGVIVYANHGFANLIQYPLEKIIGSNFVYYIQENQRKVFLDLLQEVHSNRVEYSLISKDGSQLYVSISIFPSHISESDSFHLLIVNITKLRREQKLLEASDAISKVLGESVSLHIGAEKIIQILKVYLNWEVMVIWVWNERKQCLDCKEIAHIPSIDISDFKNANENLHSVDNLTIPKRIWAYNKPIRIPDVTLEPNYLRAAAARKSKLRGALAFPFFEDSRLAGVVELYKRDSYYEEVDEELLALLTSLSIGLGQFILKKVAEEAKDELSTLLNFTVNGIYSVDKEGIIKSWNMGAEKIYGWKSSEVIGKPITIIYPEDQLGEFVKNKEALTSGKILEPFQAKRKRKDGTTVWVDISLGVVYDKEGVRSGACAVVRDITAEKRNIELLKLNEERYRSLLEATKDWIWEINHKGFIEYSNNSIEQILGYKQDEVIDKSLAYFVQIEDRENVANSVERTLVEKKWTLNDPIPFLHKNGSLRWLVCTAVPLMDEEEKLTGFRGVSQDITDLKNLERLKSEFISVTSHELRTPLTTINGVLAILAAKKLEPDQTKELIDLAYRNSQRLSKIINDILDIEKIDRGILSYHFRPIPISDLIQEAIVTSQPYAEKYNVKIEKRDNTVNVLIHADFGRLLHVLTNIISNAIKFSPSGESIVVSTQVVSDKIIVSIEDHGKGIPEEFQGKIFEKFTQAEPSSTRTNQGMGLGLSISKEIIESHGGTLSFRSIKNQGTIFSCELPLYRENQ